MLDSLLLFLRGLTQTGRARAVPVIGLFASRPPRSDLRRIEPARPAVFAQIGLVQRSCFQHRRELVARGPALGTSIRVGQKLPLAPRLGPPLVQRRLGNPFRPRQLPNSQGVRRQHLLQHSCLAFW
jgi:hypothetical protein